MTKIHPSEATYTITSVAGAVLVLLKAFGVNYPPDATGPTLFLLGAMGYSFSRWFYGRKNSNSEPETSVSEPTSVV